MDIMFDDDTKIRKLNPDKSYSRVENTENKNAQEVLIEIAKENAEKQKSEFNDDNRVINSKSNNTINQDNNDNKRMNLFDKIKNFFKNLTH